MQGNTRARRRAIYLSPSILANEMAQQIKAFASNPEDLSLILKPTW